MTQDELHDGCGVLQTVRMMSDAGFGNDLDGPTQGAITRGQHRGIFGHRHYFVGLADDVEQRHPCGHQDVQPIDGVAGEGFLFALGECP